MFCATIEPRPELGFENGWLGMSARSLGVLAVPHSSSAPGSPGPRICGGDGRGGGGEMSSTVRGTASPSTVGETPARTAGSSESHRHRESMRPPTGIACASLRSGESATQSGSCPLEETYFPRRWSRDEHGFESDGSNVDALCGARAIHTPRSYRVRQGRAARSGESATQSGSCPLKETCSARRLSRDPSLGSRTDGSECRRAHWAC
jgi:hypothetical protein